MRHDAEMSLGEHLEDLRKRIFRAAIGVLIAAILCGVFYKEVMTALLAPYLQAWHKLHPEISAPENPGEKTPGTNPANPAEKSPAEKTPDGKAANPGEKAATPGAKPLTNPLAELAKSIPPRIIMGSPAAGILCIILVTTIVGIFVASPWVLYQIWAFIGVGLHEKERRFVTTYGPLSFGLFLSGGALFYFLVLPYGLAALMSPLMTITLDGIPLIDPSVMLEDYLKFIALMTLVFGLTFQTPLVIIFLARTGIVPLETLARKQKLIIFIMIILGALIAPAGDPFTCTLMAVPLIVLYEIGLLAAWLMGRKERRLRLAEEAAEKAREAQRPPEDQNPYGGGNQDDQGNSL